MPQENELVEVIELVRLNTEEIRKNTEEIVKLTKKISECAVAIRARIPPKKIVPSFL